MDAGKGSSLVVAEGAFRFAPSPSAQDKPSRPSATGQGRSSRGALHLDPRRLAPSRTGEATPDLGALAGHPVDPDQRVTSPQLPSLQLASAPIVDCTVPAMIFLFKVSCSAAVPCMRSSDEK
jgi:hypothetical protein